MATLEIRYKGTTIASISPFVIDRRGHLVNAVIAAPNNVSAQVGHMWIGGKNGLAGRGTATENSATDGLFEVVVIPDDEFEFLDGDFLTLSYIQLWNIKVNP